MNEYTMEVTVRESAKDSYATRMIRKMILDSVGKANGNQLCEYYKKYCELKNVKFSDDFFNCSNTNAGTESKFVPAELYDTEPLIQRDIEGEMLRKEDNAPNVMHYLAYALNKHDEEIELNETMDSVTAMKLDAAIGRSQEINEKILYTFFYMAVAAGYAMALEEK